MGSEAAFYRSYLGLPILFNAEGFARNVHSVHLGVAVTQSCVYNR